MNFIYSSMVILVLIGSQLQAQDNVFIDERDQVSYPTVQIAGQTWLGADLQYISPKAYFQDQDAAKIGNFYYWEEALDACPEGWRLTTKDDWASFGVAVVAEKLDTNSAILGDMEALLINSVGQLSIVFRQDKEHSFFEEHTVLHLIPMGRIENGTVIASRQFVDYWVAPFSKKQPYYHIHLRKYSLEGHAHKHHVAPKAKKRRLFKVRCVME